MPGKPDILVLLIDSFRQGQTRQMPGRTDILMFRSNFSHCRRRWRSWQCSTTGRRRSRRRARKGRRCSRAPIITHWINFMLIIIIAKVRRQSSEEERRVVRPRAGEHLEEERSSSSRSLRSRTRERRRSYAGHHRGVRHQPSSLQS